MFRDRNSLLLEDPLALGLAMELALSVMGQMASLDEQQKSVGFQAGTKRRGGNSNDRVIHLI
jgi:hypothetical protein